jgi:serine/threonine protein phosphatase 1
MAKTLVIGDIHGCWDELQALLDTVPLTRDDTIIHVGDLMDRGPHPQPVIEFFMDTPNTHSILGNRDDKHIRAYDGELGYSGSRQVTRKHQFKDDDAYAAAIAYLRDLPLYIDLPEALIFHGYYETDKPPNEQRREVLLGHPEGETYLGPDYMLWYEDYTDNKPLLFGHRQYPFLHLERKIYPLDTRCVYGGTLTGLLLPDFRFYGIPARQNHYLAYQAAY